MQREIEPLIHYLYTLKVHETNKLLCTVSRKTFIIGFAAAVKSILQIAQNILVESSWKYLMTYRFSQDHLELFFAQIRRKNSWNNNPDALQFTSAMKSLLVKNSITASANSNCSTFEPDNNTGFQLKWSYKQFAKWHDDIDNVETQWETPVDSTITEDDCDVTLALGINSDLTFVTNNVLYYISGFIVRKLLRIIECNTCINNIVSNSKNILTAYTILVDLKNNGGLVYASQNVYKIVGTTEKEFAIVIGNNKRNIPKPDAYNL